MIELTRELSDLKAETDSQKIIIEHTTHVMENYKLKLNESQEQERSLRKERDDIIQDACTLMVCPLICSMTIGLGEGETN